MATYKLIQDIEAEDHILGPLSLRQFIFALITAFLLYINVLLVSKGAAIVLIGTLPPTLLVGFFAFPFGGDQPTEIWALAKIRYWFKPRQRLWNQSGVKELVTITVPKKIEHIYTDGLSQTEVQSRLKALANTIDTRGWAIKNINLDTYTHNPLAPVESDRLFDIGAIPQAVPDDDLSASDDILDGTNSPIAQQFDGMINQAAQDHRQALINQMNDPAVGQSPTTPAGNSQSSAQPANYWFVDPTPGLPASQTQPVAPAAANPTADEQALGAQLKAQATASQASYEHLHTLQPAGAQAVSGGAATSQTTPISSPAPVSLPVSDPAILSLANNNDLNVATLAREAQKNKGEDEVVIPLR